MGRLGAILGVLERSFGDSGPSWAILGASWPVLERFGRSKVDPAPGTSHLLTGLRPGGPRTRFPVMCTCIYTHTYIRTYVHTHTIGHFARAQFLASYKYNAWRCRRRSQRGRDVRRDQNQCSGQGQGLGTAGCSVVGSGIGGKGRARLRGRARACRAPRVSEIALGLG